MDVSSPELAHRARRHVELARLRVDELRAMYERRLGGLTTAGWRKDEIITAIIDAEVYRDAH